jgi:primosomal protein N' (replication factor Y)
MKQPEKLVRYSRTLRSNMTNAEQKLWHRIRRGQIGGHHFRRQHPVPPYIADFACIAAKLVIELDGSQHAENQGDVARTRHLQSKGWRVLRFWNNEINENPEGILIVVQAALDETRPLPNPPPTLLGEGITMS